VTDIRGECEGYSSSEHGLDQVYDVSSIKCRTKSQFTGR